jgi:cytochrome c oxidase subunit 2
MSDLQTKKPQWWKSKDVKITAALWVVLSVLIGVISGIVNSRPMGQPASETMANTIHIMKLFTWVSAPVAGLVAAIAIKALMQKMHFGDNPPAEADHQISDSPKATALWLIVSALLCLFALVFGMVVFQRDNNTLLDVHATDVNVTGQQWAWNFDYIDNGKFQSEDLYLPVNKPVHFHVTSLDVVHSFWIVQMGIKVDANPGYITETAVTPTKIGVYDLRCAELCGLLHAYMQKKVHVVSQQDYNNWVTSHGGTI